MTPPPQERGWPSRFVVVQVPNAPLFVALAASVAGRLVHGVGHRYTSAVLHVALGIWAFGEVTGGVNWLRRLLGAGFLIYVVVSLARGLRA